MVNSGDIRYEPTPDTTLAEYAAAWVDMVPHLAQLTDLASRAQVIVEFGIRGAVSTWAMLDGLPPEGSLYGVDVQSKPPIPPRVRNDPRFVFIRGNSLEVSLPHRADLAMIDTSHTYLQTLLELRRVATLGPDIIALHDYFSPEYPGVAQAVAEFVGEGYSLARVHQSRYGLAILQRA